MNPKKKIKRKKAVQNDTERNKPFGILARLKRTDILIPLIIVFSFIYPLRAAISQYFILQYPDDIDLVYSASMRFHQPLTILFERTGTGFRPMINMLYVLGYSLWDANEMYYYLMNGVLFVGSMVFLYLLIKTLHSRLAGVIAILLYLFLDASFILISKMNYTTSIAEIFFITSSLYYSVYFFERGNRKSLVLAIILAILAFFSKEPSIVIIPTVNILYLTHKWKSIDSKTRVMGLLVNISLPLLFLIMTMLISSEVSISSTDPASELIKSRLLFYVEQELSWQLKNPYILFLACSGAIFFHRFKKEEYGGLSISVIKSMILISIIAFAVIASQTGTLYSLIGATLIILLLTISFLFGDMNQRLGIAWFGVGLAPLLVTSRPVQPTYLAEPNLGMCLFIGVTVAEYLKYIFSGKSNAPKDKIDISRIIKTVNIAIIILILLLQLWAVPTEINNTNGYHKMISEDQTSFKEAVDYLKATVPRNGTIYYITTEQRQKVGGGQIDWTALHWLLCVKGRCDIEIKSLSSLDTTEENQHGGYIALLSNLDVYIFVNEYKNLTASNIFISQKEIKNGESIAYVLGLKNSG